MHVHYRDVNGHISEISGQSPSPAFYLSDPSIDRFLDAYCVRAARWLGLEIPGPDDRWKGEKGEKREKRAKTPVTPALSRREREKKRK